jgi:hypothetical protein
MIEQESVPLGQENFEQAKALRDLAKDLAGMDGLEVPTEEHHREAAETFDRLGKMPKQSGDLLDV